MLTIYRDRLYRHVRLKYYHPAKVTLVLTDNEEMFYRLDSRECSSIKEAICQGTSNTHRH